MHLSSAATDGIYASSWLKVAGQLHHPTSHAFITSSKVNHYTRKLVLQYRWGLLPTNGFLHKIGKSPTKNCPLCGEVDGGHHAISGCRALSASYTRRHNDAGTEILEAISRGTEGHHVLLSDVGFTKRRSPDEAPEYMQTCRLMRHMDPPRYMSELLVNALQAYTDSVPDILLVEFDNANAFWHFTIVELKYCRDTDPTPQQMRAAAQHSALQDLIKEHEPRAYVKVVTLTLGVSGVIYEAFMNDMRTHLGVTGPALTSLARRLHFIAANNLRKIWAQRLAITRGQQKGASRKGQRRQGSSALRQQKGVRRQQATQPQPKPWRASNSNKRTLPPKQPDHRKRHRKR